MFTIENLIFSWSHLLVRKIMKMRKMSRTWKGEKTHELFLLHAEYFIELGDYLFISRGSKQEAIFQSMSTLKFSPDEESEIFSLRLLNFSIYLFWISKLSTDLFILHAMLFTSPEIYILGVLVSRRAMLIIILTFSLFAQGHLHHGKQQRPTNCCYIPSQSCKQGKI